MDFLFYLDCATSRLLFSHTREESKTVPKEHTMNSWGSQYQQKSLHKFKRRRLIKASTVLPQLKITSLVNVLKQKVLFFHNSDSEKYHFMTQKYFKEERLPQSSK